MHKAEIKLILEALLVSHDEPLSIERLLDVFPEYEKPCQEQIRAALDALSVDYQQRAFELKEVASGFCLQTRVNYAHWIAALNKERPGKYSHALLETLAVIVYRQPVTRAEIEEIRGVSINLTSLKTLIEREWVKVAGYRDVPGKPAVYVTTKVFLDYFNLKTLDELPEIEVFLDRESQQQNESVLPHV
ncbi:MAG: SMC-Scp complex subunit ScpB [Legionellales bacterium RIFCSPHIGHO2_12_FULL_42_9]|nr:MAG: SMC-Scp complex subunit ScpB [Legionellales bacterium RIFCSPHIGHO2_12_FULL_42_9]